MVPRTGVLAVLVGVAQVAGAQASIVGTVLDSLHNGAPLRGATVVVKELSRYVPTDSRGRYRVDSVPQGRYSLTVLHPALDSLDLAADQFAVDVPDHGTVTAPLALPSANAIYARLCGRTRDPSLGVLIGHVTDIDAGAPVSRAVVTADWMEYAVKGGRLAGAVVRVNAIANSSGVFVLCGVPVDSPYQLFALVDSSGTGPLPMLPDPRGVANRNLSVSRRDSAAVLGTAQLLDSLNRETPISARRGSATFSGRLVSPQGQPYAGVVRLVGSRLEARADSSGRFVLQGVPAGTRAIEVRAIGIAPATLVLDFPSGRTRDTAIVIDRRAQTLGGVTVVGEAKPTDKSGFTERRRQGMGHYLDEAEIEKRPTADLMGQFLRLPALAIVVDYKGIRHLMMRGGNVSGGGGGMGAIGTKMRMCSPSFFLDGAYFPLDVGEDPYKTLLAFVPLTNAKGIEVYVGAGSIPAAFDKSSTTGCGSVLIWTK